MVLQISTQFPANCRWQTPLRTLVSHLKVLVRLSDASAGGQGDWPWSGIRTVQLLRLRANQKSSHPHCRILTGTLAKMEKLQPKRRVSQPSHYYPSSAQFVLLPKDVAKTSPCRIHLTSAVLPQCSAPHRCRNSQMPQSNNLPGSRPPPAPATTLDPLCGGPRPGDAGQKTSSHRPS